MKHERARRAERHERARQAPAVPTVGPYTAACESRGVPPHEGQADSTFASAHVGCSFVLTSALHLATSVGQRGLADSQRVLDEIAKHQEKPVCAGFSWCLARCRLRPAPSVRFRS